MSDLSEREAFEAWLFDRDPLDANTDRRPNGSYLYGPTQSRWEAWQARAALPVQQGWQPIETAPKTSQSRLVWCPENRCTFAVTWDKVRVTWRHFGGGDALVEAPTHWMPIPPAPEASPTTEDAK
jgi:hypothetical protein